MPAPAKGAEKPKGSPVVKDNGAFDGLTDDAKPAAKAGAMKKASAAPVASEDAAKPAAKDEPAKTVDVSRAATTLRIGLNLEKSGKTAAALSYYRRIVKDFPGTPSAKTAAEHIRRWRRIDGNVS